jgi:hypothetical protein
MPVGEFSQGIDSVGCGGHLIAGVLQRSRAGIPYCLVIINDKDLHGINCATNYGEV